MGDLMSIKRYLTDWLEFDCQSATDAEFERFVVVSCGLILAVGAPLLGVIIYMAVRP
jgi:hypothetical protein